jgi:hypothetical protein
MWISRREPPITLLVFQGRLIDHFEGFRPFHSSDCSKNKKIWFFFFSSFSSYYLLFISLFVSFLFIRFLVVFLFQHFLVVWLSFLMFMFLLLFQWYWWLPGGLCWSLLSVNGQLVLGEVLMHVSIKMHRLCVFTLYAHRQKPKIDRQEM